MAILIVSLVLSAYMKPRGINLNYTQPVNRVRCLAIKKGLKINPAPFESLMSTAEQNQSKGQRKISSLDVMQNTVLQVVPVDAPGVNHWIGG